MTDEPASPNGRERVGVILVHGIGEQRRFEHLDGQGRELIEALIKQPDREVTVAIDGGAASAFLAEQASWNSGPNGPVHVFVKDTKTSEVTHEIHFHEIWWADINESYSMAKQFRLWLWGLSAWLYPRGPNRPMRGQQQGDIILPVVPGLTESDHKLRQRAQLFLVGVLFAVAALPLGFGLALWLRLVNARSPDFLRTVTNYVSGVKLFNQKTRWGPSIFPVKDDFLDTLGDPPRVSVRRRVVRAYAEMALANYDRWYIVAHSQGTVAAFNGLMEPPYAWPGYFDEAGWERLRRAGLGAFCGFPDPAGHQMPRRPVWSGPEEGARRDKIFERLHGIITLGSPIEKFAAIWPARVPICLLPAFSAKTFWLNFFDPLDPVSGRLTAYQIHREAACPPPQDLGYAASPFFFLAHIRYLDGTELPGRSIGRHGADGPERRL
jgi:hypothetical protein